MSTAELLLKNSLMPIEPSTLHRSFLYTAFLYIDLREAIILGLREEVRSSGCGNFGFQFFWVLSATIMLQRVLTCLQTCKQTFQSILHIIVTHNRTVNTDGWPGYGKPIDQMVEHYNL